MKKIASNKWIQLQVVVFTTLISLSSCNKEDIQSPLNNTDFQFSQNTFRANNQDVNHLLSIGYDEQDIKINQSLDLLAKSLLEVVKNKEYADILIESARNSEIKSANLKQIFATNYEFKKAVNAELSKNSSLRTDGDGDDYFDDLEEGLVYDVDYYATVHIPNIETADMSLMPIISSGVNADGEADPSVEDNIIAWFTNEDGSISEIFVSEAEAMATTIPVMVVSLGTDFEDGRLNSNIIYGQDNSSENYKTNVVSELHGYQFKINYRYENIGNSEFAIGTLFLRPSDGYAYYQAFGHIVDVDKNDIGKDLLHWHEIGNFPTAGTNGIFNYYERDWEQSAKSLGFLTSNAGINTYMFGERKYFSEWYTYGPLLHDNPYNFAFHNANWVTNNVSNAKGYITVWRIDS
ncbi:MAG: hypothetical protein ABR94_04750 [Sphingobacteriales bacterium BACL12 MAG-120802-bin5]|jgi:hypothetical protein|nr:MAG: hypothetical protein ABR94_04750 [Sphingobacteriales bacterium BACL12 MAG-120802-bin5]